MAHGSHSVEHVHQELREVLRGRGLRATSSRVAVLTALHQRGAPMTHDEIMAQVGETAFDKASVWRILADLADIGLLRRMDLGDRVWRYELVDACRPVDADHAHFLCESCGTVSCLPPVELRGRDGKVPDVLRGADVHLRLSGTCVTCTDI